MDRNKKNNNVPKLRFPGFVGEWEEKTISDIADVLQGFGFPDKYQGQTTGDLPFCKVGDISAAVDKEERIILHAANYVNYSLLPTLHARPIPEGATIFAKIGEAIRSNKRIMTGCPCLIDNNAAAVKAKEGESDEFIFYLMLNVNLADYAGGIVPSVNKSTVETISVLIPPTIAEQKKIASCLSDIDSLIAAQNRIVAAVKEKKKGLMQQLFPQNGETTPRLRFPGFSGEWEEKALGEVGTFVRGLSYNKGEVTQNNKSTLVLRSNNIVQDTAVDCKNGLQFVTKGPSSEQILRKGDIVICLSNGSSNLVGKSASYEGDYDGVVTVGAFCGIYRSTAPITKYLVQTPAYKKSIDLIKQGGNGALANLYGREILRLRFYFPSPEEQKKITECLMALDDIIVTETNKLEALKAHKKGLMQQLFPQPSK